ncbi:MAG: tetratricopeptide repeat protein [Pedosphaera parvula]|nr:tetratricopeptide repeat protein [Pedosphaera parvula]
MNGETAYGVGEALRQQSWQGNDDYAKLATEAMKWFERAIILNPFDPYPPLRYGMCLDWLDKHGQAVAYYERARRADPNNYYILAHLGWHYVQSGDHAAARKWFTQSLKVKPLDNSIAQSYMEILNARSGVLQSDHK